MKEIKRCAPGPATPASFNLTTYRSLSSVYKKMCGIYKDVLYPPLMGVTITCCGELPGPKRLERIVLPSPHTSARRKGSQRSINLLECKVHGQGKEASLRHDHWVLHFFCIKAEDLIKDIQINFWTWGKHFSHFFCYINCFVNFSV